MNYFYLLNYLKENNYLPSQLIDALRYELDKHIYYFGDQFSYHLEKKIKNKSFTSVQVMIKDLFFLVQMLRNIEVNHQRKTIISNAYFTFNSELRKLDYNVYSPSWNIARDRIVLTTPKLYQKSEKIKEAFKKASFFELISHQFIQILQDFDYELNRFFEHKKIAALFVPSDLSFFENLSIKGAKRVNIPSFVFLHGLPGRYNAIDDNRADYLIVWGEKIKENYIKAGVSPNKIFVSGHPYYRFNKLKNLKFSLDNILVITKSMNGAPPCSDEVRLSDRGNLILYLFSIENVLRSFGVKSVRFRPHPSENPDWYLKFINPEFFKVDKGRLQESIQKSSLIVGPTSTVFLESLCYGINYLIYEPSINNIDLINYTLVPPFDGTDERIPVAKSEKELSYLLRHKASVDSLILEEYLRNSFDISFVKHLI